MGNINICQIYILLQVVICSTEQCYYTDTTAFCKNGLLPGRIPKSITEVRLEDVDLENFWVNHSNDEFQQWADVITLDIHSRKGRILHPEALKGLYNLHYLGLHGVVNTIPNEAFRDLQNLVTLNISGNQFLHETNLEQTFISTGRNFTLPKLQAIIMSDLFTTVLKPVKLENTFKAISKGRQIKYVDLSGVFLENMDLKTFKPLCDSGLQTLILRRVVLANICDPPHCLENRSICSTLEYIDVSGLETPSLRVKVSVILHFGFPSTTLIFNHAKTILLDETLTFEVDIRNYLIFPLQTYATKLNNASCTKNKLKWLNCTCLSATLQSLDISQNIIEYVHPELLSKHGQLKHLNLSSNRLYLMQRHYPEDFGNLLKFHVFLKEIDLSRNGLKNLPRHMFILSKKLTHLDLSYNMITGIPLETVNLRALQILVLKGNSIQTVGSDTIGKLDNLFSNTGTLFDLSNNSFICSCKDENKATIQWLKMTKAITNSKPYSCVLHNTERKLDILSSALEDTDRYCLALRQKQILSITLPTLCAVFASIMIIAVYGWYQRRKERVFQNVLRQLRAGMFPKQFLVFLSFCSDDTELVIGEVYPKLCETIQNITQNNQAMVCLGDRYFRPGFPILDEAEDYIKKSAVQLAVISNAFCKSIWCEHELNEAVHARMPVIMLFIEHVDRKNMPSVVKRIFRSNVHASWVREGNGGHPVPEWKVLCNSIFSLAAGTKKKIEDDEHLVYAV